MEDQMNGKDATGSSAERAKPRGPLPWAQFEWAEWLSNPAKRRLTPEQRGRFMDVWATTHGTRTPGDMTEEDVRCWAGYSEREWAAVRGVFAGVFNTTRRKGRWLLLDVIEKHRAAMKRTKRFKVRAKVAADSRRRNTASGNEMTSRSTRQAHPDYREERKPDMPDVQTVAGVDALPRIGTNGTAAVSDLLARALSAGCADGTDGTLANTGGQRE